MEALFEWIWGKGFIGKAIVILLIAICCLILLAVAGLVLFIIGAAIWFLFIAPAQEGDFAGTVYKAYSTLTAYKGSETAIVLPATLEDKPVIYLSGFRDESGLVEEITIPDEVSLADVGLMLNVPSLQRYHVSDTHPTLMVIDGALYTKDGKTLLSYPQGRMGEAVIPEGVEGIMTGAFNNCAISSLILPDSLQVIYANGICNLRVLRMVEIPAGVTGFGIDAFTNTVDNAARTQLIVTEGSPAHVWALESGVSIREILPAQEAPAADPAEPAADPAEVPAA